MHCTYVPSLHADAEERRTLELSLRHAIAKEEMHLNFQPVVNAQSEGIVSFEALLRWTSEEHGMVSPAKFIPLAEDTRLIVPIGKWVLHEACRQATRWPEEIKVAVNVSGEQLLEPNFTATVVEALAATGLPANRLELEVTESVFLRDGRTANEALEAIIALGCSIALDDFGTGYSSLSQLRSLPFDRLKIDRSFVTEMAAENVGGELVRAIVALGKGLSLPVTAEGIENGKVLQELQGLGDIKGQGYLYGRPEDARATRQRLSKLGLLVKDHKRLSRIYGPALLGAREISKTG